MAKKRLADYMKNLDWTPVAQDGVTHVALLKIGPYVFEMQRKVGGKEIMAIEDLARYVQLARNGKLGSMVQYEDELETPGA